MSTEAEAEFADLVRDILEADPENGVLLVLAVLHRCRREALELELTQRAAVLEADILLTSGGRLRSKERGAD